MNGFSAYIALGGNIGDVASNMLQCIALFDEACSVEKCSSLYTTPPWGYENQAMFLNACIKIKTEMLPEKLLKYCKHLENIFGRQRSDKWGPRTLDLDILFYRPIPNYKSKDLKLPHPFMLQRAFVLLPLCEISPNLKINSKTIKFYVNNLKIEDVSKILLDKTNKKWKTIV